jgi:hypothetical protein
VLNKDLSFAAVPAAFPVKAGNGLMLILFRLPIN